MEKINEIDIKAKCFTKINVEIDTSFQNYKDMETIIDFNKQNDYKYSIVANSNNSNLLDLKVITLLLKNGYKIANYEDNRIIFKHYKLMEQETKELEEIKKIRGW